MEVYGLGFSIRPRRGRVEVKSELGSELLHPSSLILVAGVGRLKSSTVEMIAEAGGLLAFRRGFRVVRLDYTGSRQAALLRAQLSAYDDSEKCLELAHSFVKASTLNKLWILEALENQGFNVNAQIGEVRELLSVKPSSRSELRRLEARIAKSYFEALREVLDPSYGFEARTRRPPKDCFSAALSYAYVKLYAYCEAALKSAGLDVRVGFLHEPFRHRASLALDLAEEFRQPVVDAALLTLFTGRALSPQRDFRRDGEAVLLGVAGRAKVDRAMRRRLDLKVRGSSLLDWIYSQALKLADCLLGGGQYEPFTLYTS